MDGLYHSIRVIIDNMNRSIKSFLKKLHISRADYNELKRILGKKINQLRYRKKYTAKDIIDVMVSMGMKKGDCVMVHASMKEFYNYKGTADDIIKGILDVIGEEGTLLMPSYPMIKFHLNEYCFSKDDPKYDPNFVHFDVRNTPSAAGYLSEVFRKYPGVKRSINVQHATCAIGKLADYFLSEHYKSVTAWDEYSPYYKMSQVDTKVFTLGCPFLVSTMVHVPESMLREKHPYFAMLFEKPITYNYLDEQGQLKHAEMLILCRDRDSDDSYIVKRFFPKEEMHIQYLTNLQIKMVQSVYTYNLYYSLAQKGIVRLKVPSPVGFF